MIEQQYMVLVLDDDEAVRRSFVDFLEDRGWLTCSASTAETALEIVEQGAIDGAIVDIRLPGMDGNAFIRAVSKIQSTLACVICTGSPEYLPPTDVVRLPQVSDTVFSKPVFELIAMELELRSQIEKCTGKESDRG